MRAYGYTRLLTTVQIEDDFGREAQERVIFELASRQGLEILQVFHDEGSSGASGDAVRPGLAALLAALEDGGAEVVIVAGLDRLARDVVLQETICARLAKRGISLVSVAEPDVAADLTRTMIRQILGSVAEYERALIKSRMLAGKAVKASGGGYVGGRPAFGWRVKNGYLVQDPKEQKIMARMRDLKGAGMSLNGIAQTLNSEGSTSKMGTSWSATTVRRVIRRSERQAGGAAID